MVLYRGNSSLFRKSLRGLPCRHPVDGGRDSGWRAGLHDRLAAPRLGSLAGCDPSFHGPYRRRRV